MNTEANIKDQKVKNAENNLISLQSALRSLRRDTNTKEHNQEIKEQILKKLGFKDELGEIESVSNDEFETFIIWAVKDCFGVSLNADIILMVSGLLHGYSYQQYPKLMGRKNKFLENSNYLQNYPPSKKAKKGGKYLDDTSNLPFFLDDPTVFNKLDDEGKETCRKNLSTIENKLFDEFGRYLFEKKNIKDLYKEKTEYLISDWDSGVRLPSPSYPETNYERLIWWELKKSNEKRGFFHFPKKIQNEENKETLEIEGTLETAKIENNKVIKIILDASKFFVAVIFLGSIVNFISTPSVKHDPMSQSRMNMAGSIDVTRKNNSGNAENKNAISQNEEDEENERLMQIANKSF